MYNTHPAVSSAWSRESPPRAHWGLGPEGQPGEEELGRVDSAPLPPDPPLGGPLRMLVRGYDSATQRDQSSEPLRPNPVGFCSASAWRGSGHVWMGAGRGEAAGPGRRELTTVLPIGHGL